MGSSPRTRCVYHPLPDAARALSARSPETPSYLDHLSDQSAQWRTPPFKALIRQWWRGGAGDN